MVRTIASKQMSMMEKTIKMVAKDAKNDRKEITEDSLITIRKIPFFDIPMELSIPSKAMKRKKAQETQTDNGFAGLLGCNRR